MKQTINKCFACSAAFVMPLNRHTLSLGVGSAYVIAKSKRHRLQRKVASKTDG